MLRPTYDDRMPDQGQRESAHLSAPRAASIPASWALFALVCACGGGDPTAPDTGLRPPVLKDVGVAADAGADADATVGVDAPSAADASAPDAGPPPPDGDGDGLPDGVDPQPTTPNLALFRDDFSAGDPTWLFTSSAMAARGGVLSVTETDAIVREGWLGPQPNWTDTVAYTRVRVLRRGRSTDDGAGRFSLIARVQQVAPDRYLACGVDARAGTAFLAEHNGGNTAGRTLEERPLTGAVGSWHDVRMSADATRIRCFVDDHVMEVVNALYSSGSAGVRSFDVAFEADLMAVHAL